MPITGINKPSAWKGQPLKGEWLLTMKVDGVRALHHPREGWLSRAGNQLFNIPPWQSGQARDCEVFVGSFRDTIIATRTRVPKADTPPIHREHLFGLDQLDPRISFGNLVNPSASDIRMQLTRARSLGFEGLVLRQGQRWIKVKSIESHDTKVMGVVEGRGKHAGMLGFITTPLGKVGSGFSIAERRELWAETQAGTLIGQVVEVNCMELSAAAGKFRHPIFIRMRPDKASS